MENVKQINDNLAVATNQVTREQLHQAAVEGFKSVMNLRDPHEEGFMCDEKQQAEAAGLDYVNVPVKPNEMTEELADRVLAEMNKLPKPALIHCKSGMRSGAMALMNVAISQGISPEEAMQKGREMGFDCDSSPQMKEFFKHYVSEHSKDS